MRRLRRWLLILAILLGACTPEVTRIAGPIARAICALVPLYGTRRVYEVSPDGSVRALEADASTSP